MRYQFAQTNRLGNRANNQDRCAVRETDDAVLLVVADGMGGHARGDLAAQTAVDVLSRRFLNHEGAIEDPAAFLERSLEAAHDQVVRVGMAQHPQIEPRTTCVACIVQGNRAWWAHAGDSRLYLVREGRTHTRTRDHATVEELIARGEISEDEARHHPMRNSVTQCLGGAITSPDVTLGEVDELREGDCFLLCSDGLWSALEEGELTGVTTAAELASALEDLAEQAEQASYPNSDNISAVLLRWLGHSETDQPPARTHGVNRRTSGGDTLTDAIAEIQKALDEYESELDPHLK